MTVPVRWRKANRSGQEGNCVELAHTLTVVRDSKIPGGPTLRADALALLAAVRSGRLDR